MVFAKKDKGGDDGGGSKDKGSDKGSSGDNGGGSGDNGGGSGGSSSDNSGGEGTTTTEGSGGNSNGGDGSSSDTGNAPPTQTPTNKEICPNGSAPNADGKCPTTTTEQQNTAPPAAGQQTTCPDGSTPDVTGNCSSSASNPATTLAPNQGTTTTTTPAAQDGAHILVMPNADGTCPPGSHKFPGSQVCEKDTATPSSSGGGQVPPECQGIIAGPKDKCSLGTSALPTLPTSINGAPLTPQQQYEQCLSGIGGGIPGNCKPPSATTTEQNIAPLQTLTPQQTCKDGSIPSATGICQDGSIPQQVCQVGEVLDAKGGCLSPGVESAIKNGTLIPLGDGKFKLATAPPVPNTNSIAPICPVGFHLALSKCVVNSGGCPSGTVQDDDICSPSQAHYNIPTNAAKLQDGTCPSGYHSTDAQCEINSQQKLPNGMCPDGTVLTTNDKCVTMPVLPGTSTGSGGGFIQMFPMKPATPPATPPNQETPPLQPQG